MMPVKKIYVENFLQSLLETLENDHKLKAVKKSYGENDERYKATTTFDFSGWLDADIYSFSAAYFEAIAFASGKISKQPNGDKLSFKYQKHVERKVVPDLILRTNDEFSFETIIDKIKVKQQALKASDPEESAVSIWGFFGGAAAIATVGALALGAVTIAAKK